jgi:hypothetical protein
MTAAFLMSVALAAQAPQQTTPAPQQPPSATTPQAPPSQPQTRSESAAGKITVSGCIEKAEAPATAGFVLKDVTPSSGSSSAGGAVGTSGTKASEYRLDAESAQLTPHVGHRVEIVGTSAPMADSSAARSAEPGAKPAPPSLKVESIKMVSQNCTTK